MKQNRADTRGRLLAAARAIFYSNGYQKATIQMIAAQADANIAAVNYHFGDKASLLAVVIAEDLVQFHASMPRVSLESSVPPTETLGQFVRWFFTRFHPDMKVAGLLREVSSGGEILDAMMQTVVRPEIDALTGILRALNPDAPLDHVQMQAICVITMMTHTVRYLPALDTLFTDCQITATDFDAWADRVTEICLHGIARVAQSHASV